MALATVAMPAAASAAPTEPLSSEQWAISPGAVLNLPSAWSVAQGTGVVVAVVDSGVRIDHPDLAPNAWTNFGEIPDNGVDDDGNGYADDVHGIDLTTAGARNNLTDDNGHGTHVAGIIAAADNNKGVVGVAYKARIMTIKTQGADGTGSMSSVATGIEYAAAMGAKVINLSLAGPSNNAAIVRAVAAAEKAGALIVVAAGNAASDDDKTPTYPASLAAPNLVSVAATAPNEGRNLAPFSNYGRTTVQLAAPGESVLSTANDGAYEQRSGTSMAAPMVAGVAALIASANPGISAAALRAQLLTSAGRSTLPVASGYLDAGAAVRGTRSSLPAAGKPAPDVAIVTSTGKRSGKATKLTVRVKVSGATAAIKGYDLSLGQRKLGRINTRSTDWNVRLSLAGKVIGTKLTVVARSKAGKRLARSAARVTAPQKKQAPGSGPRSKTTEAAAAKRAQRRAGGAPRHRATVSISGSPTALPLVADLAYYYRQAVPRPPVFSLVAGGSEAGVFDAARRITDIGLATRAPSASDPASVRFTPFARSAVCIVTNRGNPVPSLTRAQLAQLLSGQTASWRDVTGSGDAELLGASLAPGNGADAVFLAAFVDLATPVAYTPRTFATPSQLRAFVASNGNAWGYVDLAFTNHLHAVAFEGVPCSRETVVSGSYRGAYDLSFVTRRTPSRAASKFMRWVRTSPTARRVIQTRFVALR